MPADISQFLAGLAAHRQVMIAKLLKAVTDFAEHVIGDAQEICPVDTGALQGSASFTQAELQGNVIVSVIGFNTVYAVFVHECLESRGGKTINHPFGGPKFLELAITNNGPSFNPFMASAIAA